MNKELIHKELVFSASRSSGKGGQNVNKLNTKVTLKFHIENSEGLNDDEKAIIKKKLANSINTEGELYLDSESEKSQLANKEEAVKKFFRLLRNTLKENKPRKKTQPKFSSIKERLDEKKRRGEIKQLRSKKNFGNE